MNNDAEDRFVLDLDWDVPWVSPSSFEDHLPLVDIAVLVVEDTVIAIYQVIFEFRAFVN